MKWTSGLFTEYHVFIPSKYADMILQEFVKDSPSLDLFRIDKKGIYHFSNEGVCSWFDFATVIADFAGNKCYIKPIHSDEFPSKVKRPHFSVLDKSKFTTTFNYIIPYWMVSLKKCMLTINN